MTVDCYDSYEDKISVSSLVIDWLLLTFFFNSVFKKKIRAKRALHDECRLDLFTDALMAYLPFFCIAYIFDFFLYSDRLYGLFSLFHFIS